MPDEDLSFSTHDARDFDRLIAQYVDRLNEGETLDKQEIRDSHPELASELIDHLEAFAGFGGDGDTSEPLGTLGDYTLLRQIGRGGMGVVYEAWENSLDRRVALKVLPPGVAADARSSTRFLREAQIAARLSHPQIVPVHATGIKDATPWYAMEFVEGETLAHLLTRIKDAEPDAETPFGKKDDVRYFLNLAEAFAAVADGLQHAHSKGVVHRDIKPSNLILDGEGKLRILDFGLARIEGHESLTLSGDLMGTVLYMSPEQAMAKRIPLDHRTDVYSLGATMYEVLTGEPPFRGKNQHDTLSQIIARDPRSPRQLNTGVPRDLETIALKCLRKDPKDRYGTAEALGQDIRRFVRRDPIEAKPEATLERVARNLRRFRRILAVAAALAMALAYAGWQVRARNRAEEERNRVQYALTVRRAVTRLHEGMFTLAPAENRANRTIVTLSQEWWAPVTEMEFRSLWGTARAAIVEEAIEDLEAMTRAVPRARDAHYYLARAYAIVERHEDAHQEVERALACDPGFVPARVLEWELEKEESPAFDELYEDSVASDAGGGWQRLWLDAYRGMRAREWSEAAAAYGRLLTSTEEVEPYIGLRIEAAMGRGVALLEAEEIRTAREVFAAALELVPSSVEAKILLAKARHRDGEPERAAEILERLHETLEPETRDEVTLLFAAVYHSLGAPARMLEWIEKLEQSQLRERLKCFFLFHEHEHALAVEAGRLAIEEGPDDPAAHYWLARALLELAVTGKGLADPSEFLRVASRSADLQPDNSSARKLREAAESLAEKFGKTGNTAKTQAILTVHSTAGVQQGYFDDVKAVPGLAGVEIEGVCSVTADGQEMYFDHWRKRYHYDIWVSERQKDGSWGGYAVVEEVSSSDMDAFPVVSGDGLTLVFGRRPRSLKGPGNLYLASRAARGEPWGGVRPLDEINDPARRDGPGSLSADGLVLYFFSSRRADDLGRPSAGESDLFVATRTSRDRPFGNVRGLDGLNGPWSDWGPAVSADGLTAFWCDIPLDEEGKGLREGGEGEPDLWMATRPDLDAPFGPPMNLGPPINSVIGDVLPFVSADWPAEGSKLYFSRSIEGKHSYLYEATWHAVATR